MKIQNISFNKISNYINSSNKIEKLNQKSYNDSFSFCGKVLSYDEVRPLRLRAYQIQEESINHQKEAYSVQAEGYELLTNAKDEYINASKLCNYFKKNPSKISLVLKNGNILEFKFEFKKNNFSLEIEEKRPDNSTVKTISAINFVPSKIANYSSEGVDVYEYGGNNVLVIKNFGADPYNLGNFDEMYAFRSGKLTSASFDGNLLSNPASSDKMIVYFDDKPIIYSTENSASAQGFDCKADERFVYNGTSLTNYYSGFNAHDNGGMEWGESFHFDKGRFIGLIMNGVQKNKNEDILSNNATFLNDDNQFLHTTNLRARVSDFGLPVFADYEN